jgi:hypothetical protein
MQISLAQQLISFTGALLVLIGYVGHQIKRMDTRSALYNLLNAAGGAMLLYAAFRPFQLGFVIMEGTWTVVSFAALVRALRHSEVSGA